MTQEKEIKKEQNIGCGTILLSFAIFCVINGIIDCKGGERAKEQVKQEMKKSKHDTGREK